MTCWSCLVTRMTQMTRMTRNSDAGAVGIFPCRMQGPLIANMTLNDPPLASVPNYSNLTFAKKERYKSRIKLGPCLVGCSDRWLRVPCIGLTRRPSPWKVAWSCLPLAALNSGLVRQLILLCAKACRWPLWLYTSAPNIRVPAPSTNDTRCATSTRDSSWCY
jgi:hypothetical protein